MKKTMTKTFIYLVIYFFFSCDNYTEERNKVKEERTLCILLVWSLNLEGNRSQTIGNLLCAERADKKNEKIDDREYLLP
ncbi:MAG: hypothetical protein IPL26_05530 [Leptospiraceae bacterium]|nr:hypothetical protein [Leptospiraceae bacterium]